MLPEFFQTLCCAQRIFFPFFHKDITAKCSSLKQHVACRASTAFTKFRYILRAPVHFVLKRVKRFAWELSGSCPGVKMR